MMHQAAVWGRRGIIIHDRFGKYVVCSNSRSCSRPCVRHMTFSKSRVASNKASSSGDINREPFDILGVPENTSYANVKSAFLRLALKHHPDMKTGSAKEFTRIREAFEALREGPNGLCVLHSHHTDNSTAPWTDESLYKWIHRETGQDLSFRMDSNTRRQVAKASTMSQGGLDKGGMWEMARMIALEEQQNPSPKELPKELEAPTSTSTRRRRK